MTVECQYGIAIGDPAGSLPPPHQLESFEQPKPKDPRTFIGWALKAFLT
jgi:hypothetical protein